MARIVSSLLFSIGFSSVFCFLVALPGEAVVADEFKAFSPIDTPLPREIEGHFDTKTSKISEWMSEIVELTTANRFCYRVSSEVATTHTTSRPEKDFQIHSLNFIRAEDPGKQIERVIVVSQPLAENDAIRTQNGIAMDRAIEFDLYRTPETANLVRPISSSGLVYEGIYALEGDERFDRRLRSTKIFSPLLACLVPVAQTVHGNSTSVRKHSVLSKTIKGTRTIGAYNNVLVSVGSTSFMVTFKDKRPVQFEHWSTVDKKSGEPVVSDRIGAQWQKCKSGELVPVRIHGVRTAKIFPSEFVCKVDWKFGDDVEDDYFDPTSQGLIRFDELVEAKVYSD